MEAEPKGKKPGGGCIRAPGEGWGCWAHREEPQRLLLGQEQRRTSHLPLADAARKTSCVGSWPGLLWKALCLRRHVQRRAWGDLSSSYSLAPSQGPTPEPLGEQGVGARARAAPGPEAVHLQPQGPLRTLLRSCSQHQGQGPPGSGARACFRRGSFWGPGADTGPRSRCRLRTRAHVSQQLNDTPLSAFPLFCFILITYLSSHSSFLEITSPNKLPAQKTSSQALLFSFIQVKTVPKGETVAHVF